MLRRGPPPPVVVHPAEAAWLEGHWTSPWTWEDSFAEVLVALSLPPREVRGLAWPSVSIEPRGATVRLGDDVVWRAAFVADVRPEQCNWRYVGAGELTICLVKGILGAPWAALVAQQPTRRLAEAGGVARRDAGAAPAPTGADSGSLASPRPLDGVASGARTRYAAGAATPRMSARAPEPPPAATAFQLASAARLAASPVLPPVPPPPPPPPPLPPPTAPRRSTLDAVNDILHPELSRGAVRPLPAAAELLSPLEAVNRILRGNAIFAGTTAALPPAPVRAGADGGPGGGGGTTSRDGASAHENDAGAPPPPTLVSPPHARAHAPVADEYESLVHGSTSVATATPRSGGAHAAVPTSRLRASPTSRLAAAALSVELLPAACLLQAADDGGDACDSNSNDGGSPRPPPLPATDVDFFCALPPGGGDGGGDDERASLAARTDAGIMAAPTRFDALVVAPAGALAAARGGGSGGGVAVPYADAAAFVATAGLPAYPTLGAARGRVRVAFPRVPGRYEVHYLHGGDGAGVSGRGGVIAGCSAVVHVMPALGRRRPVARTPPPALLSPVEQSAPLAAHHNASLHAVAGGGGGVDATEAAGARVESVDAHARAPYSSASSREARFTLQDARGDASASRADPPATPPRHASHAAAPPAGFAAAAAAWATSAVAEALLAAAAVDVLPVLESAAVAEAEAQSSRRPPPPPMDQRAAAPPSSPARSGGDAAHAIADTADGEAATATAQPRRPSLPPQPSRTLIPPPPSVAAAVAAAVAHHGGRQATPPRRAAPAVPTPATAMPPRRVSAAGGAGAVPDAGAALIATGAAAAASADAPWRGSSAGAGGAAAAVDGGVDDEGSVTTRGGGGGRDQRAPSVGAATGVLTGAPAAADARAERVAAAATSAAPVGDVTSDAPPPPPPPPPQPPRPQPSPPPPPPPRSRDHAAQPVTEPHAVAVAATHRPPMSTAPTTRADAPPAASPSPAAVRGARATDARPLPPPSVTTPGAWSPPFVLEKQARIGVYQLLVPLPPGLAVAAASPLRRGGRGHAAAGCVELPERWRPGASVVDAPDGGGSAVDVTFELPLAPVASPRATSSGGGGGGASPGSPPRPRAPAAAPPSPPPPPPPGRRQHFHLHLDVPHRIEAAKATVALGDDVISVRLPVFYGGGAVPDRPASVITPGEVGALRARGGAVRCRACGAHVTRHGAGAGPPLRAFVLPSEYWLEWSDFWLCHGEEANSLIPDADYGAQRGCVLVGETAVQLHPDDADWGALRVASPPPAPAAASHVVAADAAGDVLAALLAPTAPAVVSCARCGSALGSTLLLPDAGGGGGLDAAGAPVPPAGGWRDKLNLDAEPVLRLNKDALAVSPASGGGGGGDNDGGSRPDTGIIGSRGGPSGSGGNALAAYSAAGRVAASLLSAVLAHQQYRFTATRPRRGWPRATGTGVARGSSEDETDASDGRSRAGRGAGRVGRDGEEVLQLVVVNWNTSVRGSLHAAPPAAADGGALGDGAAAAPSGYAPPGCAVAGDFLSAARDAPVLKLRYRLVSRTRVDAGGGGGGGRLGDASPASQVPRSPASPATPSRASGGGAADAAPPDGDEELALSAHDWDAVADALEAGARALPASCRDIGGMRVGFLPLPC